MADGLITLPSKGDLAQTIARCEAVVRARGLHVFSKFDHANNAREAGLTLRPTTVVWFGDAKLGTKLMAAHPTIAIDLPHRLLVYTDDNGQTWLAYNDPVWLAARHGVGGDAGIQGTAAALTAIVQEVVG